MALLNNSNQESRVLQLDKGVLKTNAAVASVQAPIGWTVRMFSKLKHPALPKETFFLFEKEDAPGALIGIYFSGLVLEEENARVRRKTLFDTKWNLRAGTKEADEVDETLPALTPTSKLEHIETVSGPHAVRSDNRKCVGVKSTELKGLAALMFEFQNTSTSARTIEYCVDVRGTGEALYCFYYSAPKDLFDELMNTAIQTFNSIVWRKDFDVQTNIAPED